MSLWMQDVHVRSTNKHLKHPLYFFGVNISLLLLLLLLMHVYENKWCEEHEWIMDEKKKEKEKNKQRRERDLLIQWTIGS